MRIRLRGPSGASTVILGEDATVADLRSSITEKTSLTKFDIKYGYPPKPLYLEKDTSLLSSLEVHLDGEQLTISVHDGSGTEGRSLEKDAGVNKDPSKTVTSTSRKDSAETQSSGPILFAGMPGAKAQKEPKPDNPPARSNDPISLKRKAKEMAQKRLAQVEKLPAALLAELRTDWIVVLAVQAAHAASSSRRLEDGRG
jgi:ubiquitin thioesterase OTU1